MSVRVRENRIAEGMEEERKIRIFLVLIDGIGKPITIMQHSKQYSWDDFVNQVRKMFGFEPGIHLSFDSEKNGRIGDLNQFEEDDLVVVTSPNESDSKTSKFIEQLKKMEDTNEMEKKKENWKRRRS